MSKIFFMQIIKASDLFKNIENIDNGEFEKSGTIDLDFTDIDSIGIKDITVLLNIQKVALLNNKSLSISNVNPNVRKLLDTTGINKTFDNISITNPILRK